MSDLNTEIKIGADASGVEAGVSKAKRSLKDLGDAAQKAGKDAGAGIGSIGAGGDKSAKDVERATKNMQGSLQRLLAEQKAGAKGSREYYEALADTRGISRNAIKPILDQIDAAKSKTLQAKNAADSWTSSLGKVGPMVAVAFSGAAITGFLGKVVSVQREFDVLNSSLKTVTGSSAAAEREMAWLKDFAKETPFGLAQATQGFVKMKALGLDPTRAALTSFGNTASAMGKDLNQMIEAVADASTGEFERLKEFGIKAKKDGDQVSLTFQGITTTIRNSSQEITKYLENIGNASFGGAMEERAKTLDGTIAALGDTWDELFRTVSTNNVGSLIFDSVTLANGVLEDATTIVRALGGAASDAGKDFGALTAIQGGVATFFETVSVLAANTLYVLRQTGDTMAGVAAGYKAFFSFDFDAVRAIGAEMKANGEAARKEIDATTARILHARKEAGIYASYATRNASAATDPRRIDLSPASKSGAATPGKPKKEELSDYDKLIQKLGVELPKAAAEAEAAQLGYNKAQTEFLALAGSDVWAKFTNTQRATVAALFAQKIVSEEAVDAQKRLDKANLAAAQAREKYLTSLDTGLDKIRADIQAQEDATSRMGLSKEAIADLDAAKLEMLATDLELQAIKAMDRNLDQQTYDALKKQAAAYRDLGRAKKGGAAKEAALDMEKANAEAAKKAQEDWAKASDEINRTLTDSLMRGFESGKDFAKNLRDTVVNMFKTMVLRPVISAIINPVAGALTGAMGLSGAAQAAGGISTAMSGASFLGNAAGILGGAGTAAGYGASALFAGNGLGALSGGFGMLTGGGGLGMAAQGAGMIAGVLGPITLGIGAVMALVKKLDDSGTMHTGALSQYSTAGGLANSTTHGAFGMGFGGVDYSAETEKFTGAMAQSIVLMLDSTATTFGKEAGYKAATAFADDTSKDGAWGGLLITKLNETIINWDPARTSKWAPKEFADGAAGKEQYLAAVAADVRVALESIGLPAWATGMLDKLGQGASIEQLAGAIDQINAAKAAFEAFAQYMPFFAGVADSALGKLVDASGGVGALAGNMSAFVDGFYTDAEKLAVNTQNVTDALAKLGFEMPKTREEFKALVAAQLATAGLQLGSSGEMIRVSKAMNESAATSAAGLLALSGAVDAVMQATDAVTDATKAATKAENDLAAARQGALRSAFGGLAKSLADMRAGVGESEARVADARMDIWSGYADAQQKVIDLEMQAADATRSFAQSLRGFVSDLTTGPNSGLGLDARYQMLGQQFSATATRAGAGDQGARDSLTGVASAYLDAARSNARTSVEYARDAARVSIQLNKLATAAESDPLVQKYDAESLSIQQQIADAQIDVVKYLALMEATGTSTDLGIQTVDKTLAALRDEYVGATQAQAAANLKLDVALAALDALGLTEELVKAVAANQSNSLSAALNITDEALASITGALGLTPENLAGIGQQFAVEIALLVGQVATDLAGSLSAALAFDPAAFDALRTVIGYDTASPDFAALQTILGFDLESAKFRSLQTILGMAPEASAQVDALLGGISFAPATVGQIDLIAEGLGFSDAAMAVVERLKAGVGFGSNAQFQIDLLAAGVSFTDSTQQQIGQLGQGVGFTDSAAAQAAHLTAGLGFADRAREQIALIAAGVSLTDAAGAQVDGLNAGVGWSADVAAQVQGLLGGVPLTAAASAQVDGLLAGLQLAAADRVTIQQLLGGIGFDTDTATALQDGLGLQQGLLPMLGTALGLSAEAAKAIGVISGMGTIDQTVRNAYAMVGRSGIGTDVSQIDQEGYDFWTKSLATGAVSMTDFTQQFLQSAAGAPDEALRAYIAPYMKKLGIPGFAVGTSYVPQDMVAQIHRGEEITPRPYVDAQAADRQQTNALLARLVQSNAELKAELAEIKRSSQTTATGMTGIVNKQVTLVTEVA